MLLKKNQKRNKQAKIDGKKKFREAAQKTKVLLIEHYGTKQIN